MSVGSPIVKGLEGDVAFSCVSPFTEGSLALDVYDMINAHRAVSYLGRLCHVPWTDGEKVFTVTAFRNSNAYSVSLT